MIAAAGLLASSSSNGQLVYQTASSSILAGGVSKHPPAFGDWEDSAMDTEVSPLNGQVRATDFATQSSTFSATDVDGAGSCQIQLNDPGAFGQADSKLMVTFKTSTPLAFNYYAACSGGDPAYDFVSFDAISSISGAGSDAKSGILNVGSHTINCFCAAQNTDSGSWNFSLTVYPVPKGSVFTAAQQEALYEYQNAVKVTGAMSVGAAAVLATIAGTLTAPVAVVCLVGGAALLAGAEMNEGILHDPPDTNYMLIADVTLPNLPFVSAGTNITSAEAAGLNAWLLNAGQTWANYRALSTTINRFQSAYSAGDSYWQTQQTMAAQRLESQLALLTSEEPGLRSNLVVQITAMGITNAFIDASNLTSIVTNLTASNGLPAMLQSNLVAIGADATTISNIGTLFFSIDPNAAAGYFPGCLLNPVFDAGSMAAAAAFSYSSPVLLNPSVGGGNIIFDVPTLAGVTYQLQFSPDLRSASNWTTLTSSNAVTNLISFTNPIPSGDTVGFYRVLHR